MKWVYRRPFDIRRARPLNVALYPDGETTASGSPSIVKPTSSGTLVVTNKASGTPSLTKITSTGTLVLELPASGSPSLTKITSAGNTDLVHLSAGSPELTKPTSAGTGILPDTLASGTPSLTKATSAGTALQPLPVVTDVDGDETWADGDTGLVITGTGFV